MRIPATAKIIPILLMICSSFSYAQTYDTLVTEDYRIIRGVDKNGEPHGHYEKFDFYEELIVEIGEYKNGNKEGEWITVDPERCTKEITHYKKGIKEGDYQFSDDCSISEMEVSGSYKNGKKSGKWVTTYHYFEMDPKYRKASFDYFQYDRLILTEKFKNGKREGESYYELDSDQYRRVILFHGFYKNDRRIGKWELLNVLFDMDAGNPIIGDAYGTFRYENGILQGPVRINEGIVYKGLVLPYDSLLNDIDVRIEYDDRAYSVGRFTNGKKSGEWKVFNKNGSLIRTDVFEESKQLQGEEKKTAELIIDDLDIDNIRFIDIDNEKALLLLGTSNYRSDIKYWVYDLTRKRLLFSATLAKPAASINRMRFHKKTSHIVISDYTNDEHIYVNFRNNKVEGIYSGYSAEFQSIYNEWELDSTEVPEKRNLKDFMRDRVNWQPQWADIRKVRHRGNQVLIEYEGYSGKEFSLVNLANGSVRKVSSDVEIDNQTGLFTDINYNEFALRTTCDTCSAVHNRLLKEVSSTAGEPFFLFLGTGEKIRFHYVDETRASYYKSRDNVSTIHFWNGKLPDRNVHDIRFVVSKSGDYIFMARDNYYMSSKTIDTYAYFKYDSDLYPLEQFDLKYNRPDIILERLGYADTAVIQAYHKAYLKRLSKMGFTEDMLKDDFDLPGIRIMNRDSIPQKSDEGSIQLDLELFDKKFDLDRINVYINDVAVFGTDGISVSGYHSRSLDTAITVSLARGKNTIQVSALNVSGVESYKEMLEVYCTVGKTQPDLYVLAVGISQFEDVRYNLTYAAKDANDVVNLFSTAKAFDKVYTQTLLNEQVTRENVMAMRSFLEKADINDEVIVFFAGHGVLDADFDYYFAMHNMDFGKPGATGLQYESFENLMDGIKPLRKTILIDACHSGEIDKEEVVATSVTEHNPDIKFRSVGTGVAAKLGSENSFELSRSLFADLRKGTGTTIISAAGGMEFAMESDAYNNGLFTYCLTEGLISGNADLNKDGEIWLSELKAYVSGRVPELSDGYQQPTSRIENKSVDFRVW